MTDIRTPLPSPAALACLVVSRVDEFRRAGGIDSDRAISVAAGVNRDVVSRLRAVADGRRHKGFVYDKVHLLDAWLTANWPQQGQCTTGGSPDA